MAMMGLLEKGKEGWKERFLMQISERYGLQKIIKAENTNYRLIGLPFFNKERNNKFEKEFNKIISRGQHG